MPTAPTARRAHRLPLALVAIATSTGLWFGLTAPSTSPVTPPAPPAASAASIVTTPPLP